MTKKKFKREEIKELKVGDKIEHHLFGYGTVKISEPIFEANRAVVKFDNYDKPMSIITHFAKIRMVEPKNETV